MVKPALGDGQNICDSPIKAAVLHKLAASSCFGVTEQQSTTFVRGVTSTENQDVLLFFVFSTTADEAEFSKKLKAENLRFGDRGLHSINVQQDNVDLDLNQRWDSSGNEDNSSFNPFKRPPQRCRQ